MKNNDSNESSFLSIIDTWPEYYETMDEGLGTTYERFILHRYFSQLMDTYDIQSLIEVPSFGMTGVSGINSLWWAKNGIRPVIVDTDDERIAKAKNVWNSIPLPVNFESVKNLDGLPFGNKTFDMSWNFASLWFVKDLNKFLNEMSRITQKVIFICVPNNIGLGYTLRKIFNQQTIPDFYPENIDSRKITKSLKNLGWSKIKQGYLDIPPWPDIAMKKEDLFKKIGLNYLNSRENQNGDNQSRKCIVDYFNGSNPGLETEILKYDLLEKAPTPVKQLWGHHRYFVFEKG